MGTQAITVKVTVSKLAADWKIHSAKNMPTEK